MLESIRDIGGEMILARVNLVIGDQDAADENFFWAGFIAEQDGYDLGSKNKVYKEPAYLALYPELKSWHENGYDHGLTSWEISNCPYCQDPLIEMCPVHD